MANVLGQLLVELGINTAAFQEGLQKATYQTARFGKDVEDSFKRTANSISTVTATFGAFGPAGAAVSQVLLKMGESIGKATKEFAGINPVLGVFAGAAAGVVSAAVAIGASMIGIAVHAAEATDEMYHQSEIAGTSFSNFQKLAAGAGMYNISSESLAMSLTRMSRQALTASESASYSSTAFGRLGINVRDASGHLKDSSDLFLEVMGRLSSMSNATERNALAMQTMGRAGIQLIPALSAGVEQFKAYGDFAQRVGAVLDDEAGPAAHAFSIATKEVELITKGAQNQLQIGIIPALTQLIDAYTQASHSGQVFADAGNFIGVELKGFAAIIAGLIGGVKLLGLEYEKTAVIFNLKLQANPATWGASWDAMRAQLKTIDDEEKNVDNDWKLFVAHLNEPVKYPEAPKSGFEADTSRKGARGAAARGAEPDVVGEFVRKTDEGVTEQLALAAAVAETTAQYGILKADAEAEKAVADKRLELENKMRSLLSEQTALKSGDAAKVDEINKKMVDAKQRLAASGTFDAGAIGSEIAAYQEQLDTIKGPHVNVQVENVEAKIKATQDQLNSLPAAKIKVTADFEAKSVLESVNKMKELVLKDTEDLGAKIDDQLDALGEGSSPVDKLFAGADDKTKPLEKAIGNVRESLELLTAAGAQPAILTAISTAIDEATTKSETLKTSFESSAVLEALQKTDEEVNKTTTSLSEELSVQETIATAGTTGPADKLFASADEKAKSLAKSVGEAREEYRRLSSTSLDSTAIEAARDKVEQLAAALRTARGEFESVAVLTAVNQANDSISKTILTISEQVREQQALNAARLAGVSSYSTAEIDEKVRSETVELQTLEAEYARVSDASSESYDPTAAEAAQKGIETLKGSISSLRGEYAALAAADPEYWLKAADAVDQYDEKFADLPTAVGAFVNSVVVQGQRLQGEFFGALKTGFDGFESSLSKFIVTGKGGFTQVLSSMEQSLLRVVIQFGVAKIAALSFDAVNKVLKIPDVAAGTPASTTGGGAAGAVGGVKGTIQGVEGLFGIGKSAAGAAGKSVETLALTTNTAALTALTTAVSAHGIATAVAAATTTASTAATASDAVTTSVNSAVVTANTAATTGHTAALLAHMGAIFAHMGAIFAHMGVMLAHLGVMVVHGVILAAHLIAMIANTIATIANTIATIISAIIGLFAGGGNVTGGVPIVVGEHRPEIFVPHTDGRIVPAIPSTFGAENVTATRQAAAAAGSVSTTATGFYGGGQSALERYGGSVTSSGVGSGPVTSADRYLGQERAPESSLPSAGRSYAPAALGATPGTGFGEGGGHTINVNHTINAVDSAGFAALLDKHSAVVAEQVSNALRKANQRLP